MKKAIILLAVGIALTACSSTRQIGTDLPDFTPSPTASPSKTAKPTKKAAPKPKQTKTQAPAPRETRAPTLEVTIQGGRCGPGKCGFDPQLVVVAKGTKVVVKNADVDPRSFVTNDGSYDSGMIQPGKSWSFVADKAGRFPFADAHTAPYANGELIVQEAE